MEFGFCPSRLGFAGPGSLLLLSPAAFWVLDCSWAAAPLTVRAPTATVRAADPTPRNPRRDNCLSRLQFPFFHLLDVKQNSTGISDLIPRMSTLIHPRPLRVNQIAVGRIMFQFGRPCMVCSDRRVRQLARLSHFQRLAGGGRSPMRTFLRRNSLLTGKIQGILPLS
jgi:hypothetical protein